MKLQDETNTKILYLNNHPLDDFLGLAPIEIHALIYDAFGDKSPVHFQENIDDNTLDKIPLFRIAEDFLKIIQRDKQIKLTPLGALPKKIMVEIYEKRFLLDEDIENGLTKLWKEDDCISIKSARLTFEIAGLVRKYNGKLMLTKTGTELLETKKRPRDFQTIFQSFYR